jgi:hypothetical protein
MARMEPNLATLLLRHQPARQNCSRNLTIGTEPIEATILLQRGFFRYVNKALDALLLPFMHGTDASALASAVILKLHFEIRGDNE